MTEKEINAYWAFVEKTAKEVDSWPAWKRNGSGLNLPARKCNRHDDCDKADREKGWYAGSHCHDDCCSDCFGD